jgi:hypothetical protein
MRDGVVRTKIECEPIMSELIQLIVLT